MKKIFALVSVVFLLLVALLVAPFLIPVEHFKGPMAEQFKALTGRTLEIRGPIHLTLLPDIALSAEDIRISNPPGFGGEDFVTAKSLALDVALKPLLNKQLVVNGLDIKTPVIHLTRLASGTANWEFSTGNKTAQTPEKTAEASQKQSAPAFHKLTVSDGSISFADAGKNTITVSDVDVSFNWPKPTAAATWDVMGKYNGQRVRLRGTMAAPLTVLNGGKSALEAKLEAASLAAKFSGKIEKLSPWVVEGELESAITDLPTFFEWTGVKSGDVALAKEASLNGHYRISATSVTGKNIDFGWDEFGIGGEGGINFSGTVPYVTGSLTFPDTDLNRFSKTNHPPAGGNDSKASQGWNDIPMNLSALKMINADLKLHFDNLFSGALSLEDVDSQLKLQNGALSLAIKSAKLFRGPVNGLVQVTTTNGNNGYNVTLRGEKIDAANLMQALFGKNKIGGTLTLSAALHGTGRSVRDMVESLTGNGNITVRDGAIQGVNLAAMARNAKTAFLKQDSTTAKTDFTELSGSFTATNGIISNRDLTMKSPLLRLSGEGQIGLPARNLHYRLNPTLVANIEGQDSTAETRGITVPIIVDGPWNNLSFRPDLAGMLQEGLRDPKAMEKNVRAIRDAAKGQLKDLKDVKGSLKDPAKLQNLIGGILGVPQPQEAPAEPVPAPATEPAPAQ